MCTTPRTRSKKVSPLDRLPRADQFLPFSDFFSSPGVSPPRRFFRRLGMTPQCLILRTIKLPPCRISTCHFSARNFFLLRPWIFLLRTLPIVDPFSSLMGLPTSANHNFQEVPSRPCPRRRDNMFLPTPSPHPIMRQFSIPLALVYLRVI